MSHWPDAHQQRQSQYAALSQMSAHLMDSAAAAAAAAPAPPPYTWGDAAAAASAPPAHAPHPQQQQQPTQPPQPHAAYPADLSAYFATPSAPQAPYFASPSAPPFELYERAAAPGAAPLQHHHAHSFPSHHHQQQQQQQQQPHGRRYTDALGGAAAPFSSYTLEHPVSEFDTLPGLAIRYNVTETQILEANGIRGHSNIHMFRMLKIPMQTADAQVKHSDVHVTEEQRRARHVRLFAADTRCSPEEARFYLEQHNYDFAMALRARRADALVASGAAGGGGDRARLRPYDAAVRGDDDSDADDDGSDGAACRCRTCVLL